MRWPPALDGSDLDFNPFDGDAMPFPLQMWPSGVPFPSWPPRPAQLPDEIAWPPLNFNYAEMLAEKDMKAFMQRLGVPFFDDFASRFGIRNTTIPGFVPPAIRQDIERLFRSTDVSNFASNMLRLGAEAARAALNASNAARDFDGRPAFTVNSPNGSFVFKPFILPLDTPVNVLANLPFRLPMGHAAFFPFSGMPNNSVVSFGARPRNPFLPTSMSGLRIFSDVLGLSVTDINGVVIPIQNLAPGKAINFTISLSYSADAQGKVATCLYWNVQQADWQTDGCTTTAYRLAKEGGYVNCSCTHLTDFAGSVSDAAAPGSAGSGASPSIGAIIGGVVGAILVIGAIVAVVVMMNRGRSSTKGKLLRPAGNQQAAGPKNDVIINTNPASTTGSQV